MVQVEPNLQLTLKHASRCGAVLSCETLVSGRIPMKVHMQLRL